MALDLATKASIRRHLGIPAAGVVDAGTTMGLRTVTRAGNLENYMNRLQIEEECLLLGRAYGAVVLNTVPVSLGAVYSITVTPTGGVPIVVQYTATAADVAAKDSLLSVTNNFTAALIAALSGQFLVTSATIAASAGMAGAQYSTATQISLGALVGTFALTAVNASVVASGTTLPSPSYTVDDGNGDPTKATVAHGFLAVCDALEAQLLNTSQNLSFSEVGSKATGGATFRPDELGVRNSLLKKYRFEMGVFLAFYSPNPQSGIRLGGIRV